MGVILDASVVIASERGLLDLPASLRSLADEDEVYLTTVVVAELFFGVERAESERRRQRRLAFVEALVASIPALPFELASARVYARIWSQLAGSGRSIGVHDTMIAAVAIQHGHGVATRNPAHFGRVVGLDVLNWS